MPGLYKTAYNNEVYWKNFLKKADPWQGAFVEKNGSDAPLYINCTMLDYSRRLLSYDWASYPNAHSTLGFIQYVFLPTFYYSMIYNKNQRLFTPIMAQDELIKELQNSGHKQAEKMIYFLKLAESMWKLRGHKLAVALAEFCKHFNANWKEPDRWAKLEVYSDTSKISKRIREIFWCEEILREETGMTLKDFEQLCSLAQGEYVFRLLLIHFLNNNLGCVA